MKLVIKGHAIHGKKVIEILEMLGGVNTHNLYGDENYAYYTIDSDKEIKGGIYVFGDEQLCHFTLEEFEEKFPYKVGDKVIDIKTNRIVEIYKAHWSESNNCTYYDVKLCNNTGYVRNYKFLKPYKEETMEEKETMKGDEGTLVAIDLTREIKKTNEIEVILGDYEFVLKEGKTYFVKKNKYPKTYAECCDILGIEDGLWFTYEDIDYNHINPACISNYRRRRLDLYHNFERLIICRDAYWKIAGEQMGLGKPWDSRYGCGEWGYWIGYSVIENKIDLQDSRILVNHILVFPTEEMRDAFYENFKELIENCKELL